MSRARLVGIEQFEDDRGSGLIAVERIEEGIDAGTYRALLTPTRGLEALPEELRPDNPVMGYTWTTPDAAAAARLFLLGASA